MKRTANVRCTYPGCTDMAHFTYDNRKEYIEHSKDRQNYKCCRHSKPESVLSTESRFRTCTLIAVRKGDSLYWSLDGKLLSGFNHGTGFKAYAYDFPEGTKLVITAEVIIGEQYL